MVFQNNCRQRQDCLNANHIGFNKLSVCLSAEAEVVCSYYSQTVTADAKYIMMPSSRHVEYSAVIGQPSHNQ